MATAAEVSASSALDAAFAPRGVAVIGASDRLWSYGRRPIENLVRHGFPGPVIPVNPRYEQVCGLPCLSNARELSGEADLAIVLTRGDRLPETLDDLAGTGVKAAIVFAATPEVEDIGDAVRAAVDRTGVRVIGFSAAGLVSARANLMGGAFSAAWAGGLLDGPTAIVSQSGGVGAGCLNQALDRGIGMRWLLSLGTAVDISLADVVRWTRERGDLAALGVYIEGVRDGTPLLEELTQLVASGTEVVAMKVGSSDVGREIASTHTGALAGDDRIWDEALRTAGAIRVDEVDDMCALVEGFGRRGRRAASDGAGVLALSVGSGGGAAMMADHLEAAGVPLLALDAAERAAMSAHVPTGEAANPLDIAGVKGLPDEEVGALAELLRWASETPRVSEVLVCLPTMGFEEPAARVIGESALAAQGRVTVVWLAGSLGDPGRVMLRRLGVPSFDRFGLAGRFLASRSDAGSMPERSSRPLSGMLDDGPARRLLGDAGVAFPRRVAVAEGDLARLREELEDVPAPWVLKVEAPGLAHKAAAGGVVLRQRPGAEAERRARAALESVRAAGALVEDVVVEELVGANVELFASLRRDATFGLVSAIGAGGSLVEALDAVALHVGVPDDEQVGELLRRSGAAALLATAGLSVEELAPGVAATVAAVARAFDADPGLTAVELNPLVPAGEPPRMVALDAVAVRDA